MTDFSSPSSDSYPPSDLGRRLYPLVLVLLALPTLVLFALPGLVDTLRCCSRLDTGQGWIEAYRELRLHSARLKELAVGEMAGHRKIRLTQNLGPAFIKAGAPGPGLRRGLADLRGTIFWVTPRRGEEWDLPVDGTPGLAPAWSEVSGKLAFYRLRRLWITDEEGSQFADLALAADGLAFTEIRWRCDGRQVALGSPRGPWQVVSLGDQGGFEGGAEGAKP